MFIANCLILGLQNKALVDHRDQQRQSMIKELVELRDSRADMKQTTARLLEKDQRQGKLLQHEQQAVSKHD